MWVLWSVVMDCFIYHYLDLHGISQGTFYIFKVCFIFPGLQVKPFGKQLANIFVLFHSEGSYYFYNITSLSWTTSCLTLVIFHNSLLMFWLKLRQASASFVLLLTIKKALRSFVKHLTGTTSCLTFCRKFII